MMIIENAAVATVDAQGTEYRNGHVVVDGEVLVAVGDGPAPARYTGTRVDASGRLVTPGLINTHHHLYQWATRGYAADSTLFQWLVELYPVWGGLDAEITHAAASAGLARLALTGCTTVADHHYVFPREGGDQLAALVSAVDRVGVRGHLVRGSMDRGQSHGGLPPDHLVEDLDAALAGTEAAIDAHHDPAPDARVRIAVGPCSPFTVTERLMIDAADLARRKGVRLHTHLAETLDEERQCLAEFGCTPAEYADKLGWLGDDVWLAHTVHLADDAVRRMGATGTGAAHCPTSNGRLGTGIAPARALLDAGAPVGLGVDGAASNESGGLGEELHQALLQARQQGGPEALTTRQALWMGTMGGARCLGREGEIGSLEPGKLADLAVWDLGGLRYAGIDDPVAALVLGATPDVSMLLVGGETVVADGRLATTDEEAVTAELRTASRRMR
ncbi:MULTISPECIES: 8-oxoguanine deaminase [Prauserella salsuginis group]|uniref:Cytosine/adenosine deaminase-related metal-dependent hydrolase n=2 Tax=Prauserella salsuginis group TaxID=2893672 RepID=A0A839XL11_9PSEU|nr:MULTISPECIES: 8-oxoguanine deaminase [Prauserella salsuginis group]MBB3661423.1 cytosine/adenosine deaminase-related metal-dependent hydrolase [Prauserella sediminis]MCR3719344.1 Cytosine/adenosine deaminase [Prauserella flava]MCR3735642.1 Cytosine/adenosine deaminase [Prauserella salsuginis]